MNVQNAIPNAEFYSCQYKTCQEKIPPSISKYLEHLALRHSQRIFAPICPICDTRYKNKNFLRIHISRKHKKTNAVAETIFQPSPVDSYSPPRSSLDYSNSSSDSHNIEPNDPQYICVIKSCKVRMYSTVELNSHIEKMHTKIRPGQFKCDDCSLEFNQKKRLTQHRQTHFLDQKEKYVAELKKIDSAAKTVFQHFDSLTSSYSTPSSSIFSSTIEEAHDAVPINFFD